MGSAAAPAPLIARGAAQLGISIQTGCVLGLIWLTEAQKQDVRSDVRTSVHRYASRGIPEAFASWASSQAGGRIHRQLAS